MIQKLKRVGNSHSLTIDKALMEQMGIGEGSLLPVRLDGRHRIVCRTEDTISESSFEEAAE